jgi:hypothetical protein
VAGAALPVVPWLAYLLAFRADFAAQMTVYGQRGDFFRPTFYLENIAAEPSRYAHLLLETQSAGAWLLLAGVLPAFAYTAISRSSADKPVSGTCRSRPDFLRLIGLGPRPPNLSASLAFGRGPGRLLGSTIVVFAALLLVLDQTKTPLYAIVLVPSMCVALGALFERSLRLPWRPWRWIAGALGLALLALVVNEGAQAYAVDRAESALVTPYLEVGQRIDAALVPGRLVLGPERWWWALRSHPYISLRSLWFQWSATTQANPQFSDLAARWQPTAVIVNNNVRDDVRAFPLALQDQFWSYLARCTLLVAEVDDPTYFETQIYRVSGCAT